jgi:SagB-type dehydrogenase family enzyme
MNSLTNLALGNIAHFETLLIPGGEARTVLLPPPARAGGMPLMEAFANRHSLRDFSAEPLPLTTLSSLLWAAAGINRQDAGGRTVPSAMNSQAVLLYVAMTSGLFLYDPARHALQLVMTDDVRHVTGKQDFVDTAPVDLVFVADDRSTQLIPAAQRQGFACITAGAMAQNVYLYAASMHLAAVIRAWFDRDALAKAMGLSVDHSLLIVQTVGKVANLKLN